jgi:hypothetical protein
MDRARIKKHLIFKKSAYNKQNKQKSTKKRKKAPIRGKKARKKTCKHNKTPFHIENYYFLKRNSHYTTIYKTHFKKEFICKTKIQTKSLLVVQLLLHTNLLV